MKRRTSMHPLSGPPINVPNSLTRKLLCGGVTGNPARISAMQSQSVKIELGPNNPIFPLST